MPAVRAWAGWALSVVAAALAFAQPTFTVLGQRAQASDLALPFAAALALGLALAGRQRVVERLRAARRPVVALAAFAGVALTAAALGEGPLRAGKLVGSLGLWLLPVLTLVVADDDVGLRRVTRGWLAGAFACALAGWAAVGAALAWPDAAWLRWALADQGTLPHGDYPRLQSTFLNPNMLCTYLTLTAGLTVGAVREGWLSARGGWVLGALVAGAAAFTLSLGLGGLPLLAAALWVPATSRRAAAARLGAGVLALAVFAAGWVTWAWPLRASARLLTWAGAWDTFVAHPLLGVGWGAPTCLVRYADVSGRTLTLTDAHHLLLSVAAQAGVLGVLAVLALLWESLGALRGEGARPLAKAAAVSVAVVFGYQGLTGAYEDARHLWLALGLVWAASATRPTAAA